MIHAKTWLNFTKKQEKEGTKEYLAYNSIYIKFKANLQCQKLGQWFPLPLRGESDQRVCEKGFWGAGIT